jgi:hypothetical protein
MNAPIAEHANLSVRSMQFQQATIFMLLMKACVLTVSGIMTMLPVLRSARLTVSLKSDKNELKAGGSK